MSRKYQFKWTPYLACGVAEGFEPPQSKEHIIEAWQYLVDIGLVWKLQGFFGRTAHALIEDGVIKERS